MPIYNVQNYIYESLRSLQDQTYKNLEIIMINDCSIDNSASIAKQFTEDQRFKLYSNSKNMGLSYTRNKGIELATGSLIYYFDPDDILSPNLFQLLINEIENKNVQLISFNYQQVESDERIPKKDAKVGYQETFSHEEMFKKLLNGELVTAPWAYITYTHLVKDKNVRFPNGRNFEDITYTPKLMANVRNMSIIHFSQGGYYYRWQRKNSITSSSNKNMQDLKKEIQDKLYLNERKLSYLSQFGFLDVSFLNSWFIRELTSIFIEKIYYLNSPELKEDFLILRKKIIKQISKPHNYLSGKDRLKEILVTNRVLCQLYRIIIIMKKNRN